LKSVHESGSTPDLLVEVFGARGIHARSVLGATSLRAGLPVILKGIVEVQSGEG
jgi:hypothetical protein